MWKIVVFAVAVSVIILSIIIFKINIENRGTLIGIVIAVGIFLFDRIYEIKKNKDEIKERFERCYKTMKKELDDHESAYTKINYPVIDDNPDFPFRTMILNIDAYESLLHSGLFTYFEDETQDRLANLYTRIRYQNKLILDRQELKSRFFINGFTEDRVNFWPVIVRPYDYLLNIYQNEIRELISKSKELIEKEEI